MKRIATLYLVRAGLFCGLLAAACMPQDNAPQDPPANTDVNASRSTSPPLTSQPPASTLTAQTFIWAPYDSVWAYLTTASSFEAWHSSPGVTFGTMPGDSLIWGNEAGPLYLGELLSFDPGEGFSHTFSFTFVEAEEASVVHWDVVEQGEVVWVRVVHDCSRAPETAGVITEVGWTKSLERLKTLLETGAAMPWPS